ncbi:HNH endonuclease signature motif containing protein [Myceligenerans indicum]|uniref:HNH endonuclease n=1 Tax=Myceligenerans indicum TaxID=2593663 RepID=A0ABS1LG02_9MICO|nr:HNH endonuclease signature motif containing protein [Myceligenerans indicum]MBL0885162.1 HNH endonuclease [Myceligenerans indicum]
MVDELGFPMPVPDRSEEELAAILATNPFDDPEVAASAALGPDRRPGQVVDRSTFLLRDIARMRPDVLLAAALRDVTGVDDAIDGEAPAAAGGLGALDDGELRRVAAGWERLISWARAGQARVAAELLARTEGPLGRDSVTGEFSDELRVTTSEAWQIAMRGEGLELYPLLAEALSAGQVDVKKTDTFLRAGAELTPVERGEAIQDLLPAAPTRTWKWISEQMNARAATLHGRKARRRDILDRCNVWAEQAGPGRGRIVADLPVVDAARTFNGVQAAAAALKDVPGETRPLGALRAAALTALVTGDLVLPCPDTVENGATDGATDAIDRTGVVVDDGTNASASLPEPAPLVEPVLDTDLIPVPHDLSGARLTGPAPTGAATPADAAAAGTRVRVIEVPATINVTVPATMLLNPVDMTPGVLEGLGPIPASDAARIAADGTWRRLLTDPESGILRDYSTQTYAPGASLRAAVTARDLTCMFPGCDRPARSGGRASTDLDHIEPFDHDHSPGEPGQTRAMNLHPLCRRHHNLKTHAGWRVTRDPVTGATHWTAPTGTRTVVDPTIIDPTVRYALTRGMTLTETPSTDKTDTPPAGMGPPPF